MAKRKARKKIVKKVDTLVPLDPVDILAFGTEDDPCFGKHHDLTTDECKRCGDCTLCQIVFNQKTEKKRDKIEKENRFKDLELVDLDKALVLIKKLKKRGTEKEKIISKLMRRFRYSKKEASKLVKNNK